TDFSLTKASSFSWMYFIANQFYLHGNKNMKIFMQAFYALEHARSSIKNNLKIPSDIQSYFSIPEPNLRELILLYIERSSSRVTAVTSIAMRDISIYFACHQGGVKFRLEKREAKNISKLSQFLTESKIDVKYLIEDYSSFWKEDQE